VAEGIVVLMRAGNADGGKGPRCDSDACNNKGSRDGMTKTSVSLQDLRRKIYDKAKTEPEWRFWGLYTHVCKLETLEWAYKEAKGNNGVPGVDEVTFEDIEAEGKGTFLEKIQQELQQKTYLPLRNRRHEIPKTGGKVRVLGIPSIRDRVVQGALKLVLEPIFEADFQDGSYGYRPKRSPQQGVERVAEAIAHGKTTVVDLDLKSYFDNVRHHILFEKVARRVNDPDVMHLLKLIVKAAGKKGVPQGGVISPLLSNIYLNEVDKMLEKAKETTMQGAYTQLEYARYADDVVVLINGHPRNRWLIEAIQRRMKEELEKLQVELNQEKSKVVDLTKGESFIFLGFVFRRVKSRSGKWRPHYTPHQKARTKLTTEIGKIFYRHRSQPVNEVIRQINPKLRGFCNYFRIGHSSHCFSYIRHWVEKKVRRHLQKARGRSGYGWKRWSSAFIYGELGLYQSYKLKRFESAAKLVS
jgi:RNA-directed DNA polymerase